MAHFYGLLIIREKPSGRHLLPREHPPVVIAQETLAIGTGASCDVQLAGLEPQHALLIADLTKSGGISLVNTCNTPITVEQHQHIDAHGKAGNGTTPSATVPVRRITLLSGDACALNNETLIDLGSYELEVRLAPGVRDRPQDEEPRSDELFRLGLGQALLPIEATPVPQPGEDDEESAREVPFVVLPGEERVLDIEAISTASNVQDLAFKLMQPAADPTQPGRPPPSWATLQRATIQLQTSAVGRGTAHNAIVLSPPRRFSSRAGSYTLQLRAQSNLALKEAARAPTFQITMLPYVELLATMRRRKLTAIRTGVYTLELHNNSNWAVPLLLELNNREDALLYEVAPAVAAPIRIEQMGDLPTYMIDPIPPGESLLLSISVRPRRRWPLGATRSLPFTLTTALDAADRGDRLAQQLGSTQGYKHIQALVAQSERSVAPLTIEAEFVQRRLPYVPLLLLAVLLLVLVLLAVPAIPLTATDLIARYQPRAITSGPLNQTLVVDGQVVAANAITMRARLAGTLTQLNDLEGCQPSPSVVMVNGCRVEHQGQIARLSFEAQLAQLGEALATLDTASQSITNTEVLWQIANAQAVLDLTLARQEVQRLGPAGGESKLRQAAEQLQRAEEALAEIQDSFSAEKTAAEIARSKAATELEQAQRAQEEAKQNLAWVNAKGTHPTEQYSVGGQLVPRPLTPAEKQQFTAAYSDTKRMVIDATQVYSLSITTYEVAKEREVVAIEQGQRAVSEARDQHQATAVGATAELLAAEDALRQAELAANAASRQNAELLAATLDQTRAIYLQLLKEYPLILQTPERQADVLQVQNLITRTQVVLAGAALPASASAQPGNEPERQLTADDRDRLFDQQLIQRQSHRLQEFDGLLSAIQGVRDLVLRVQAALRALEPLLIPANTHIVAVHARAGDQLAAGAPILTYYAGEPVPQIVANIEPAQIGGLAPIATITGTAALSQPVQLQVVRLPALYDGTGAPQTLSQTIVLTGSLANLPLYAPVKVQLTRTVLPAAQLIVPERAIFGADADTSVIVRRTVVAGDHWLNFLIPGLRNLRMDERIPIRVNARGDGRAAITVLNSARILVTDQVLVQ